MSDVHIPRNGGTPLPRSAGSALPRCAYCGEEMRYNVPRLGPDGGYVHAETGSLLCKAQIENPAVERRACPDCYGGHFRPCQTCGDSGHVLFVPNEQGHGLLPAKGEHE